MADPKPVFDTTKCRIATVVPIPFGNMLTDDSVPDPPPDIPDCSSVPVALLPPEAPCPSITGGAASVIYGSQVATPSISVGVIPGECCDFAISVALELPCPALTVTGQDSVTHDIRYTADTVGHVSLMMTQGSNCSFDFDIDVAIPCAPITAGGGNTSTQPIPYTSASLGQITLTATPSAEGCAFDLDLSANIPCAPITVDGGSSVTRTIGFGSGDGGTVTLSVAKHGDCGFDFDLSVDTGFPCPPISTGNGGTTSTTPITFSDGPVGTTTLTITAMEGCAYDFNINSQIPCPQLSSAASSGSEVLFHQSPKPGKITLIAVPGDECAYNFDVGLTLPCPQFDIPSPLKPVTYLPPGVPGAIHTVMTRSNVSPGPGYATDPLLRSQSLSASLSGILIGSPDFLEPSCEFSLDVAVDLPCPAIQATQGGSEQPILYTDSPGTVLFNVNTTPDCTFDFGIDLNMHCVQLESQAQNKPVLFDPTGVGKLTLSIDRTGDSASLSSTACDYAIDIDMTVPCPPIISNAATGRPVTFIDPTMPSYIAITAAQSGDDSCVTELDVDLQLACPTIKSLAKKKKINRSRDSHGYVTISINRPLIPSESFVPSASLIAPDNPAIIDEEGGGEVCDYTIDIDIELPLNGTAVAQINGLGSQNNLWSATIYPDGPLHPETSFNGTVTMLNLPSTTVSGMFVPVGDWVGPVFSYDDGFGNTDYFHVYKRTGLIAVTTSQITARTGTLPSVTTWGFGTADIYVFDGTFNTLVLAAQRVFNTTQSTIATGRIIQVKFIDGFLFADVDDCS